MEANLSEYVQVPIPRAACMLLFELLTTAYEKWRAENPDDVAATPMIIDLGSHAERKAFWQLEGALERTLPELFASNYTELLEASRRLLSE